MQRQGSFQSQLIQWLNDISRHPGFPSPYSAILSINFILTLLASQLQPHKRNSDMTAHKEERKYLPVFLGGKKEIFPEVPQHDFSFVLLVSFRKQAHF